MKILVIRFSSLGDLVQLEPMLRVIRFFYKDAQIEFLSSSIGKGLYGDTEYIDKCIVHSSFIDTAKNLFGNKYDLIFNLHCNSLSHLLIFLTSYKKTINISSSWKQRLFRIKAPLQDMKEMLIASGVEESHVEDYFLHEDSRKIILPSSNSEQIFNSRKKVIAISTGSSEKWLSKQWGVENYLKLIQLLQKNDLDVILVGTHLELEGSKYIINKVGNITSFVNKTNLNELKNLLANVDLYIGNDSGPVHISAALGTNTITIFGSTDVKHCPKYGRYKGIHKCLKPSEHIQCHPCYKAVCPTQMECMDDIKVEKVYSLAMEIL